MADSGDEVEEGTFGIYISGIRRGDEQNLLEVVHRKTGGIFKLPTTTNLEEIQETQSTRAMSLWLAATIPKESMPNIAFCDVMETEMYEDEELDTGTHCYARVRLQACHNKLYQEKLKGFEVALLGNLPEQDHIDRFMGDISQMMSDADIPIFWKQGQGFLETSTQWVMRSYTDRVHNTSLLEPKAAIPRR